MAPRERSQHRNSSTSHEKNQLEEMDKPGNARKNGFPSFLKLLGLVKNVHKMHNVAISVLSYGSLFLPSF